MIRLRGCAGWSGPSLSAYARRHVFAWPDPNYCILAPLTLWANSVDDKVMIFSYFSQKMGIDISCKLSPLKETIHMKCQIPFSGEKYFKMSSAGTFTHHAKRYVDCSTPGCSIYRMEFKWSQKYSKNIIISWFGLLRQVKCVSDRKRTARTQISLHIRAVWSGLSLPVYAIIEYYIMFLPRERVPKWIGWRIIGYSLRESGGKHILSFYRRPFSEGVWCTEQAKWKSHKVAFLVKIAENLQSVPSPFKLIRHVYSFKVAHP